MPASGKRRAKSRAKAAAAQDDGGFDEEAPRKLEQVSPMVDFQPGEGCVCVFFGAFPRAVLSEYAGHMATVDLRGIRLRRHVRAFCPLKGNLTKISLFHVSPPAA